MKITISILLSLLILSSGCIKYENAKSENTEYIPTISPIATDIIYPNENDVIRYVSDMKKVSIEEIKIFDFQNIRNANMVNRQPYHEGGYVAVSTINSNNSSIVMAYKNYDKNFIIASYTVKTIEDKNIFDLLSNITFPEASSANPFIGRLIPINITIINPSYNFNKNDIYQLNFTGYEPFADESKLYAKFEFVTAFNSFHGYWPRSSGWVDTKLKYIWIQNQPVV